MKIFLDSNIWLRFFLQDIQKQYESVVELLSQIESGRFKSYTSSLIFMEVNFILEKVYKLKRDEVFDLFVRIQSVRGLTIIEKTNLKLSLEYYKQYNLKFPDCLIASQLPSNTTLISFDEELSKIKEIVVKKPQEIKL
ncbi:PIN domain-containing protein [Candidatus Daviesbacteria bacterium]|nr:PIN domain-containing protein [Candidatus Daviesbacteria bacterium]